MSCAKCGSARAVLKNGRCVNVDGCERRRIDKRIEDDRKRGGRQCMAAYGVRSIRFCVLREGHTPATHANGGKEWEDGEGETTQGRALSEIFGGRLPSERLGP